jgi:hypothetical protein
MLTFTASPSTNTAKVTSNRVLRQDNGASSLVPQGAPTLPDILAKLGNKPEPQLVVQALRCLWSEPKVLQALSGALETFVEAFQDLQIAVGEQDIPQDSVREAVDFYRETLQSMLVAKLPVECQKAYAQAREESAKEMPSRNVSMHQALADMYQELQNQSVVSGSSNSSSSTSASSVSVHSALDQLNASGNGVKAIQRARQYSVLAADSQSNACHISG